MTNEQKIESTLNELYRQARAFSGDDRQIEREYIRLKGEAERAYAALGADWWRDAEQINRKLHDLLEVGN